MADLKIIVPQATRNIVTNPSVEDDTSGWVAKGSVTLTRTFDRARFGIASLQVVTDGLAENEGTFFRSTPETQNTRYFGSVYVRGQGKIRIRLIDQFNGNEDISDTQVLSDDRWIRLSVVSETGPVSSDDLRLYIETVDGLQATTFYVDGAQIEQSDFLTTYCDGEQPGCRWNIVANASESSRDAQERSGGRIVDITTEDIYVTLLSGVGMPPLRNTLQEFPFVEGAFFQRTKTLARVIDITFNIKDEEAQQRPTNELDKLHQVRQNLLDIIKPDLVRDSQAFTFIYSEVDKPAMFIKARYDAGFESSHDIRNKFFDFFTLRLIAEDPFWFEDTQEVDNLDILDTLESNDSAFRLDKQWQIPAGIETVLNFGRFAEGSDGVIWFFAEAAGNFFLYNFDGSTINQIPGVINSSSTEAIAIAANGDVYIGGNFTDIGGVAIDRLAFWDGAAWNAVGTGVDAPIVTLEFAPNGDLYLGGEFTQDGGANPLNRAARWDGVQFTPIGPAGVNGFNAAVRRIAISSDGNTVYFGGQFTDSDVGGGTNIPRVAQYNVTTNALESIGDGLDDIVRHIALDSKQNLYAGGDFTGLEGGTAGELNSIARWNGSSWEPLGTGTNGNVYGFDFDDKDILFVIGVFTVIGGVNTPNGFGIWNGSVWANPDAEIVGELVLPDLVQSILVSSINDIYLQWNDAPRDIEVAAINTVNNPGTTIARPIIHFIGPGHIKSIENQSTNALLFQTGSTYFSCACLYLLCLFCLTSLFWHI